MIKRKFAASIAVVALLALTSGALAQPQSKLVSRLDKGLIQAIWCSALLFEESFMYEVESEEAIRYEDLSFDLGDDIDTVLSEENGMRQEEIDEIWTVFDAEAMDLALTDTPEFISQLGMCETSYDDLL